MTETVRSFERGLAVIRSFDREHPAMTLAEVARTAGLNRATARRLLLTLEALGYVRRRDDQFQLTSRVLDLGYAYLSSLRVPELALPYLEELSEELHEASSVGVLDEADVVYVARIPANRVMTVSIGLGSRFPAYRTSLGRVLLAALPDDEVAALWETSDRSRPTDRTVTDLEELLERLEEVRRSGYAMVDQELELGVRSIAAPIHGPSGATIAAMNVSTHVSRTPKSELRSRYVPALLDTARQVDAALANLMR